MKTKARQSQKKNDRTMLCLANWNGPFYKSVYPIQSLRLSLSEEKRTTEEKTGKRHCEG